MEVRRTQRRSLNYIRLAAFFADQPSDVQRVVMTIPQIEHVIGSSLPPVARFPSWWRNDSSRMHSRAWLTAGWEVGNLEGGGAVVEFRRRDRP